MCNKNFNAFRPLKKKKKKSRRINVSIISNREKKIYVKKLKENQSWKDEHNREFISQILHWYNIL